eukprot:1449456-Pyramimonas_sp.AAC.1
MLKREQRLKMLTTLLEREVDADEKRKYLKALNTFSNMDGGFHTHLIRTKPPLAMNSVVCVSATRFTLFSCPDPRSACIISLAEAGGQPGDHRADAAQRQGRPADDGGGASAQSVGLRLRSDAPAPGARPPR